MKQLVSIIFALCIGNTQSFCQISFDSKPKYPADTSKIDTANNIRKWGIPLPEVIIRDTRKSPKEKLEETKSDYNDPYLYGDHKIKPKIGQKSMISFSLISSLYNKFSKRAKNAHKLDRIIESDYQQAEVDYRYTPHLVTNLTALTGTALLDFMTQYRPTYEFVSKATDYDMLIFVKKSYQQYRESHSTIPMAPSLIESNK